MVMSKNRFAVMVAALVFLSSVPVRAADPTGAQSVGISVVKADTNHKIGDRYTYRSMDLYSKVEDRQFTMRVTGVADGQVTYGNGGRVTDLLGNDIRYGKGFEVSGQQIFVPEYAIGKTWTTKYQFKREDGAEFTVTYDFKVVAREQITVPAGTFDTYRVEGDGYMHQTSGQRGGACAERHSIFKIWIVPDKVRRFIAQDYIQEGAAIGCRKYVTTRTELMSFVPGEPAARAESTAIVETPVIIPRSATVEEPPHSQSND